MDCPLVAGRYRLAGLENVTSPFGDEIAFDEREQRAVTLRVLETGWLPSRWLEERRLGALIDHPAFVRVLDTGVDPSMTRAFIAREKVEGNSLQSLLDQGPAQLDEALGVARELLAAL